MLALLLSICILVYRVEEPSTVLQWSLLGAGTLTVVAHEWLHAAVYLASGLSWTFRRVGMSFTTLGQPCPLSRAQMLWVMLLPTGLLLPLGAALTVVGGTAAYLGAPMLILTVTGCSYDLVSAGSVGRSGPATWWVDTENGVALVDLS